MSLGTRECDEEKTLFFFLSFDGPEKSSDARTCDGEWELEDINHSASSPVAVIESRDTDDPVFETF